MRRSSLVGVIRFDFTPHVQEREIELERGVPAMLLVLENFVAVAASWPRMPMRAARRVICEYVKEAIVEQADRVSEDNAGQPVDIAIACNFDGLHSLQIEELAKCVRCRAITDACNVVFVPAGKRISGSVSNADWPTIRLRGGYTSIKLRCSPQCCTTCTHRHKQCCTALGGNTASGRHTSLRHFFGLHAGHRHWQSNRRFPCQ